jgi:DNA-binding CsgD family transcriptional regulator
MSPHRGSQFKAASKIRLELLHDAQDVQVFRYFPLPTFFLDLTLTVSDLTTLIFPRFKRGKLGSVMLATLPLVPSEAERGPSDTYETSEAVSVYLLGEPKLARALNAITLEEQESDDLIDASKIDAYCERLQYDQILNRTYHAREKPDLTAIKLSKLTKREVELTKLLWQGYTSIDIAEYWHRSELTVNKHRENLYNKLGHRAAPRDLSMILAADALVNSV